MTYTRELNECTCVIYHPSDDEGRAHALELARSGDASISIIGIAMLGPCASRQAVQVGGQ